MGDDSEVERVLPGLLERVRCVELEGRPGQPTEDAKVALLEVRRMVRSGEARDEPLDDGVMRPLFGALDQCWKIAQGLEGEPSPKWKEFLGAMYEVMERMLAFPEFDDECAGRECGTGVLKRALKRVMKAGVDEQEFLGAFLRWAYSSLNQRVLLRQKIGEILVHEARANRRARPGVDTLLGVVDAIVYGMEDVGAGDSPPEVLSELVCEVLMPLFGVSAMQEETQPVLEFYNVSLVRCVCRAMRRSPSLFPVVVGLLVSSYWPGRTGESPRTVLLLTALETFLAEGPPSEESGLRGRMFESAWRVCLPVLAQCFVDDYARVAQKSLAILRPEGPVTPLIRAHCARITVETVAPPLLQRRKAHWNETVTKLWRSALETLREADEDALEIALERNLPSFIAPPAPSRHAPVVPSTSLGWRPSDGAASGAAPPLTVTGMAPWAKSGAASSSDPPVTVTGVAPWSLAGRPVVGRKEEVEEGTPAAGTKRSRGDLWQRFEAFLDMLYSAEAEKEREAQKEAALAGGRGEANGALVEQMAAMGTLRFHDLVFGNQLGEGAFSKVLYARVIRKDAAPSTWPEVAAKRISTQTIVEQGYMGSVRREMAVLRAVRHPCCVRLLDAFRYRDGCYLVLEYCPRGDLHSHVHRLGSLSAEAARFVTAELVAALGAVHDLGFVFGDLKPENVLLTEAGHCKLTDFGAARPITDSATELIASNRHALRDLRDGDWRADPRTDEERAAASRAPASSATIAPPASDPLDSADAEVEDDRVEVTAVYMSPELVKGGRPTVASDAWALGCVLYHALAGRPPMWAESDDAIERRIVHFDPKSDADFPPGFPEDARDLVRSLLEPDVTKRLGADNIRNVLSHPFFEPLGDSTTTPWKTRPPALKGGVVAPTSNAAWSRRQFSKMLSPMPRSADFSEAETYEPPKLRPDMRDAAPRCIPQRPGDDSISFLPH